MRTINIKPIPTQKIVFEANGKNYEIIIKQAGTPIVDISIDGVEKIKGIRCLINRPIIPYQYISGCNLFFISNDEDLISYEIFNKLYLLSEGEMAAIYA